MAYALGAVHAQERLTGADFRGSVKPRSTPYPRLRVVEPWQRAVVGGAAVAGSTVTATVTVLPRTVSPGRVWPRTRVPRRSRARAGALARRRAAAVPGYGAIVGSAVTIVLVLLVVNGLRLAAEGPAAASTSAVTTGSAVAGAVAQPAASRSPASVVVGEGDTVWELVRTVAPPGISIQDYAAAVVVANDVDARRLQPGTRLRLP